jgi:hypothetical protein
MSLAEFARARGLTPRQVRYQVRQNGAPIVRRGRAWLIDPRRWDAWSKVSKLESARLRRDALVEAADVVRSVIAGTLRANELQQLNAALKPWICELACGYLERRVVDELQRHATADGLPLHPAHRR